MEVNINEMERAETQSGTKGIKCLATFFTQQDIFLRRAQTRVDIVIKKLVLNTTQNLSSLG